MAENERSLFGFTIKRKKTAEDKVAKTFSRDEEDGSYQISPTGGYFGQYLDINGDEFKSDVELILKYRNITTYPEVDAAIEDIVNESITKPEDGTVVTLNTDNLEQADNVKKLITEEFENILKILDFNNKGYDLFRRWYVDVDYSIMLLSVTKPKQVLKN